MATCCHCKHTATRTLVYNGVAYALCIMCHERVLNSLAGARRLTQHVGRLLSMPLRR